MPQWYSATVYATITHEYLSPSEEVEKNIFVKFQRNVDSFDDGKF